jgi:hypothetical protein
MLGWLERQELMRALAMVLLGPASPEFSPRRALLETAQQIVFPSNILLRALPPAVEANSGSRRSAGAMACRRECLQRLLGYVSKSIGLPHTIGAIESTD